MEKFDFVFHLEREISIQSWKLKLQLKYTKSNVIVTVCAEWAKRKWQRVEMCLFCFTHEFELNERPTERANKQTNERNPSTMSIMNGSWIVTVHRWFFINVSIRCSQILLLVWQSNRASETSLNNVELLKIVNWS